MTIFVNSVYTLETDSWRYWYIERYNMVGLDREMSNYPLSTLQGAYNLIIDVDASNIVSGFETVTLAEITYWTVLSSLKPPKSVLGQITIIKDIDDGQQQTYFTDPYYKIFYTRLGGGLESSDMFHIAIGEQVIVDVTQNGMLAGIWMLDLPSEIGTKYAGV